MSSEVRGRCETPSYSFFMLRVPSFQLVAPRQTCLRGALCDSHCCYATTIINQIAVAQINLATAI